MTGNVFLHRTYLSGFYPKSVVLIRYLVPLGPDSNDSLDGTLDTLL